MEPIHKRVASHRQRLREAGLRPIQIWVADTRRPGFAETCRRQSDQLLTDPAERAALDFMERVSDWGDDQG